MKIAALLLFACLVTGCDAPKTPLQRSLTVEMHSLSDNEDTRVIVRKATQAFLRETHPDWKVYGMSLNRAGNDMGAIYHIAVDVQAEGQSKVAQLRAWFMVNDDGGTYWKVEPRN